MFYRGIIGAGCIIGRKEWGRTVKAEFSLFIGWGISMPTFQADPQDIRLSKEITKTIHRIFAWGHAALISSH